MTSPSKQDANGWRSDMENAPKDGSEFIARCGEQFPSFSCFWDGTAFVHYSHEDGLIAYPVTQWMPFPEGNYLTPEEEAAIVEDINSGRWPYLTPPVEGA